MRQSYRRGQRAADAARKQCSIADLVQALWPDFPNFASPLSIDTRSDSPLCCCLDLVIHTLPPFLHSCPGSLSVHLNWYPPLPTVAPLCYRKVRSGPVLVPAGSALLAIFFLGLGLLFFSLLSSSLRASSRST